MAPELRKVVEEAKHLCQGNGIAYEMFTDALAEYVHSVTVAVTEAPSVDVLQAQGRAQALRFLLRSLTEFRKSP